MEVRIWLRFGCLTRKELRSNKWLKIGSMGKWDTEGNLIPLQRQLRYVNDNSGIIFNLDQYNLTKTIFWNVYLIIFLIFLLHDRSVKQWWYLGSITHPSGKLCSRANTTVQNQGLNQTVLKVFVKYIAFVLKHDITYNTQI